MSKHTDHPRKYALVRVKAGDYVFLANDGKTLLRVATYAEDGSAVESGTGRAITGTFWGWWKYKGRGERADVSSFDDFEMHDCLLRSRRDAIGAALFDVEKYGQKEK
jgi:hypothetical protein